MIPQACLREASLSAARGYAEKLEHKLSNPEKTVWIKADPGNGRTVALAMIAEIMDLEVKHILLNQVFPQDIELLCATLKDTRGILVLDEYDNAHEYVQRITRYMIRHHQYRDPMNGYTCDIPQGWHIVISTNRSYQIRESWSTYLDPMEMVTFINPER